MVYIPGLKSWTLRPLELKSNMYVAIRMTFLYTETNSIVNQIYMANIKRFGNY